MRKVAVLANVLVLTVSLVCTVAYADMVGEPSCPIYGDHRMFSQGPAYAKDGYTYATLFFGGWYECDCDERFVCEGYPEIGGQIGEYVTEGAILSWDSYGSVYTFWVDPDLVYYTSQSYLEGYDFYSSLLREPTR